MNVRISKKAEKSLNTVPKSIAIGFFIWKREVEENGIEMVRKIPGYHDEPLKGKLKGIVRSARISSGYRIFYRIFYRNLEKELECILVEEVNKHDYKEIERLFRL